MADERVRELREALYRKALGYEVNLEKGDKHVPPDLEAIKMLLATEQGSSKYEFMTREELVTMAEGLLKELKGGA